VTLAIPQLTPQPRLRGASIHARGFGVAAIYSYPLSFRLALRSSGPLPFPVPTDGMHCRRLWPAEADPPELVQVDGRDVELRLSASQRGGGPVHYYVEALLGGRQVDKVRIVDGDVEFAIRLPQPGGPMRFIGSWYAP